MRTKRLLLVAAAVPLAATIAFPANGPDGRFETKLSPDQRIRQAINRLTFGARPGDFEEVRRLGVEKWIELQLHPERIPENPVLESKLKPLDSIRMDSARIRAAAASSRWVRRAARISARRISAYRVLRLHR